QSTTFPALTVAENLAIGNRFARGAGGRIAWRAVRRRASEVIERFGINAQPDDMVNTLGPATRKMIEIARALQDLEGAQRGVLVLDEPTAALPTVEVDVLLEAVRRYASQGEAIIYVTHRLEEVFAIADVATLLRDGKRVTVVRPAEITHE